jgi:hypothetical protein
MWGVSLVRQDYNFLAMIFDSGEKQISCLYQKATSSFERRGIEIHFVMPPYGRGGR